MFHRNATWYVQHLVSCFISFEPVNVYIPRIVIGNIHQRNRPHNNVIHSGTLYSHMSPIQVIYIIHVNILLVKPIHSDIIPYAISLFSCKISACIQTCSSNDLLFPLLCTERVMSSLYNHLCAVHLMHWVVYGQQRFIRRLHWLRT